MFDLKFLIDLGNTYTYFLKLLISRSISSRSYFSVHVSLTSSFWLISITEQIDINEIIFKLEKYKQ